MTINILVADDDAEIREVFEDMPLEGARVDTVENGRELVARASQNHYKLIISDKDMPVMGGEEAVRQIRQLHGYNNGNAEVWMMSGDSDRKTAEGAALNAGANRFYQKPFGRKFYDDLREFTKNHNN